MASKQDVKKELRDRLEKRKETLIQPKSDGGFKSMASTGSKDSTPSEGGSVVAEELIQESVDQKQLKVIKDLKKKNKSDEEIMMELDKQFKLSSKDLEKVAQHLLGI